jgi:hypothetical protein
VWPLLERASNAHRVTDKVDIFPPEAQWLPFAEPSADRQYEKGLKAVTMCGVEELPRLVGRESAHLPTFGPRRLHKVCHVAICEVPTHGLIERSMQDAVEM